ncbi:hypothetical protein HO133_002804 [Letharia lupina]|uniref:Uncharacterized protein n=1 Tax=Letharia lupina TaxID=560253 RepID=A0A8H6CD37_9LECA|nr:uncharacterized protein HO133_002804 [Letharia lupina]KAF6221123.1 hypothetical protein HO133_002804 [Letharia lupina]
MVVQIVKESTWPSKRLKNFPATLKRLLRKRIGPITGDFNKFFEPDETREDNEVGNFALPSRELRADSLEDYIKGVWVVDPSASSLGATVNTKEGKSCAQATI